MKTAGIIAEYNPLHLGHKYHMERAKEITGADYLIAVISGDFVQRGAPAVFDKYERTRMALLAGADLVLELPNLFACGSAEDFASAGVALLTRLGITDYLVFGSELGDVGPLLQAADLLAEEPKELKDSLKYYLSQGLSFPAAREKALSSLLSMQEFPADSSLLSSPNNILGVEYCKAILKQKSPLKPCTILRRGDYHDADLAGEKGSDGVSSQFSSASAVRAGLRKQDIIGKDQVWEELKSHIPEELHSFYRQIFPLDTDDLSSLLNYSILQNFQEGRPYTEFEGISSELSSRLIKNQYSSSPWEERIMELKTKNYTYTRISRALLHIVLGITKEKCQAMRDIGYSPYGRILGFKKTAAPLLSSAKKNSSIPLVTKTADSKTAVGPYVYSFLQQDFYASHIYQSVRAGKYKIAGKNEFTQQIAILP